MSAEIPFVKVNERRFTFHADDRGGSVIIGGKVNGLSDAAVISSARKYETPKVADNKELFDTISGILGEAGAKMLAYIDNGKKFLATGGTFMVSGSCINPAEEYESDEGKHVHICVWAKSYEDCNRIFDCLEKEWIRIEKTDNLVTFAVSKTDYVDLCHKKIDSISFDSIRDNYTEEVQAGVDRLVAGIDRMTSGIITIHGKPGTGKTYLIRSLISEFKNRRALICNPASAFLSNASMLTESMSSIEKPVVILEDFGDMLAKGVAQNFIDQYSVLLNLTDGLYSMLREAIFIVTFNLSHTEIDNAFLRPGRCLANIEVQELPKAHAQRLLPDTDPATLTKSAYTLAEVYAIRNSMPISFSKEKAMMGF